MFTQTHMLAGWAIGRCFPSKHRSVPIACSCAALLPDLPIIFQMAVDRLHGITYDAVMSPPPTVAVLSEIAHSAPAWTLCVIILAAAVSWSNYRRRTKLQAMLAFLVGGLIAHIMVDALTHQGLDGLEADYLWPWSYHLSKLTGLWNYRPLNSLRIRWQELAIDAALIAVIIWRESALRIRTRGQTNSASQKSPAFAEKEDGLA